MVPTLRPAVSLLPPSKPFRRSSHRRAWRRPAAVLISAVLALTVAAAGPSGAVTGAGAAPPPPPPFVRLLANPADPASPANSPTALARLASRNSPLDDLRDALGELASAADATAASGARQRALDILEGNPVPNRAYSGLALLNWNAAARVKDVPAGGTVTVNEVRYADHVLTDTWLLRFADPARPFTVTYRIADLTEAGSELAPAALMADGTGSQLMAQPLNLPNIGTGTFVSNRFNVDAEEATRAAIVEHSVAMPAPHLVDAVLDPNTTPGHEGLAVLLPATAARLAAAAAASGFAPGATPTESQRDAAIALIGDQAPEKLLWNDLRALVPADLVGAHAIGQQDGLLVSSMGTHTRVPAGVAVDPAADVAVTIVNDQAYASRRSIFLPPGAPLKVSVTNADHYSRSFSAVGFRNQVPIFGALDWGSFTVDRPALGNADVPAQSTRTFTLSPAATVFSLWVGSADHGGNGGAVIDLARDVHRQALAIEPSFAGPGHAAFDAAGDIWLLLGGMDTVRRITPAADPAASTFVDYPLPGGAFNLAATTPPLIPIDVVIDRRGIVWTTLGGGNAIARLDPASVTPDTSAGITTFPLAPCSAAPICTAPPPVPPPAVPGPPTRNPGQMAVTTDAAGNTVLWFAEADADAIGVMVVSPTGQKVGAADFTCGCLGPSGLALGPDGSVWFTADISNQIGRLRPASGNPFGVPVVQLFDIPSATAVFVPGIGTVNTSGPHSAAVDQGGRVWFTEEAMSKVGFLDPAKAVAGTTRGFTEFAVPLTAFGAPAAPADLVVDGAGTVFFVDEYGDLVSTVTPTGLGRSWRTEARASAPDKPMIDQHGNLWVVEAAARLLVKFNAVAVPTTPAVPPSPSPTPASAPAAAPAASAVPAPAAASPSSGPSPRPTAPGVAASGTGRAAATKPSTTTRAASTSRPAGSTGGAAGAAAAAGTGNGASAPSGSATASRLSAGASPAAPAGTGSKASAGNVATVRASGYRTSHRGRTLLLLLLAFAGAVVGGLLVAFRKQLALIVHVAPVPVAITGGAPAAQRWRLVIGVGAANKH